MWGDENVCSGRHSSHAETAEKSPVPVIIIYTVTGCHDRGRPSYLPDACLWPGKPTARYLWSALPRVHASGGVPCHHLTCPLPIASSYFGLRIYFRVTISRAMIFVATDYHYRWVEWNICFLLSLLLVRCNINGGGILWLHGVVIDRFTRSDRLPPLSPQLIWVSRNVENLHTSVMLSKTSRGISTLQRIVVVTSLAFLGPRN